MSDQLTSDRLAIRETVENWVLWRDAGDWERFATVWHDDGWMTATWFQGPARRFIEVSREGFNKGVNILHALGGWTCDVAGTRANSHPHSEFLLARLHAVRHQAVRPDAAEQQCQDTEPEEQQGGGPRAQHGVSH